MAVALAKVASAVTICKFSTIFPSTTATPWPAALAVVEGINLALG